MVLSRSNWKAQTAPHRKRPLAVRVKSLGDEVVILRPMSALRQTELAKEFDAIGSESQLGYGAALMAATLCSGEVDQATLAVESVGEPIWTRDELLSDDITQDVYRELSDLVAEFLKPKEDSAKNSTPATVSPIA